MGLCVDSDESIDLSINRSTDRIDTVCISIKPATKTPRQTAPRNETAPPAAKNFACVIWLKIRSRDAHPAMPLCCRQAPSDWQPRDAAARQLLDRLTKILSVHTHRSMHSLVPPPIILP